MQGEKLPVEAWLVLWIYLYSGVGSVNGVIGVFGFQLFRATTRYSIWILCIVLMYAVRRLSAFDHRKWLSRVLGTSPGDDMFVYVAAAVVVLIALLDQTPPAPTRGQLEKTAAMVASDRHFAEAMERTLPQKAMVFQFPIMDFPESPTTIGSYDNLRPYLYTNNLRYSFGTDKGRPKARWQQQVFQSSSSFPDFIGKLVQNGFRGLYVNRRAFGDGGESIIKVLKEMGYDQVIESEKGDLLCVVLKQTQPPAPPDELSGKAP
jgi:phosphoglycerol transferase